MTPRAIKINKTHWTHTAALRCLQRKTKTHDLKWGHGLKFFFLFVYGVSDVCAAVRFCLFGFIFAVVKSTIPSTREQSALALAWPALYRPAPGRRVSEKKKDTILYRKVRP